LANCNQTILLDLNLNHGLDSEALPCPIRACSVQQEATVPVKRQSFSFSSSNGTNATTFDAQSQTHDIQIVRWRSQDSSTSGAAITAATSALAQAVKSQKNTGTSILFAKLGQAIVGVYAGSQIDSQGLGGIIQQFAEREASYQLAHTAAAAQLCGPESLSSQILGIFVDTTGDLDSVKAALGGWNNATCLGSGRGETETWPAVTIGVVSGETIPVGPEDGGTPGNSDSDSDSDSDNDNNNNLVKRATCKYTQAVSGDGCFSVAQRCAITQAQLISYNNDANLCSNLKVGQYVCCSSGTLPDFTPQPNADGTCKSYSIKSGDYCAAIAQANTMTVAAIESRNKNTWGWAGCRYLLVSAVICLSTGSPPMPGAVANSVCGPTVPGTARPADMSTLARLNPCPLNVCCDVWGQCGITQDFCVPTPADTGAPGTAKPGTNGCVSGCNMAITNNAAPPASFMKVGYWEAWNGQRPCLHMKVSVVVFLPGYSFPRSFAITCFVFLGSSRITCYVFLGLLTLLAISTQVFHRYLLCFLGSSSVACYIFLNISGAICHQLTACWSTGEPD
jgi:chitinase